MHRELIFITGGQKSGKSTLAEKMTLQRSFSQKPIYLATAEPRDHELEERIAKHREVRGDSFETIEAPLFLSQALQGRLKEQPVLLECITLWLAQIWEHCQFDHESAMSFFREEWDKLISMCSCLIVVSNEIGMGVHPLEKSLRQIVDLYGVVNNFILSQSSQAYFCIAGGALSLTPISKIQ